MKMKWTYIILSFLFFLACGQSEEINAVEDEEALSNNTNNQVEVIEEPTYTSDTEMQHLFDTKAFEEQVMIKAEVIKILPDDNEGSRHQKFIVELTSGQTVLVSHNIDLANRIDNLREGDMVKVFGQYEWNDRGGVIHWTHHDPDGEHVGGWIEHETVFYD